MQNSHPFKLDKTLASCNIVIDSLKRLCYGIDIAVQILFMALYSYSIYTNLNNVILLIINAVLLGVSFIYFIVHLILSSKGRAKKVKAKIRQVIKYVKLGIRVFAIGLAIYELLGASYTDIKLITTLFTAVGFLIQCIFEILKHLTERYIDIIVTGVKMDVDEFMDSPLIAGVSKMVDTVKNPKSVLLETINGKFKEPEPVSETPPTKLQNKIYDKAEELNQKRQEKKSLRIENALNEFKTNIKNFFDKNNENKDNLDN